MWRWGDVQQTTRQATEGYQEGGHSSITEQAVLA
jgi:hypothetical protein